MDSGHQYFKVWSFQIFSKDGLCYKYMSENRICSSQQPFLKDFVVINAFIVICKGFIIYTITIGVLGLSTLPIN